MTKDTIDHLVRALSQSEQREHALARDLKRAQRETETLADFLEAIGVDHRVVLEGYWIDNASKLIRAHRTPNAASLDDLSDDTRLSVLTTCERLLTKPGTAGAGS